MNNKYYNCDNFYGRQPQNKQPNSREGQSDPRKIGTWFSKRLEELQDEFSSCIESDTAKLEYSVVMLESIFDSYVRKTINYCLEIIFDRPEISDSFSSYIKDFKIPFIRTAKAINEDKLTKKLGGIIKSELTYRTFINYNSLVEGCSLFGVNEDTISPWQTTIQKVFDIRGLIVHHAGMIGGSTPLKITKAEVEKWIVDIQHVQESIQKEVLVLEKKYYQPELNNDDSRSDRLRE